MDHGRFDQIARAISHNLSRRTLAGIIGLGVLEISQTADAKKKHKKKVKKNEFGCVDVGKFCRNAGQCCSNICQGKKGKKKCKAHNESTCLNGQVGLGCGGVTVACQTPSGGLGQCETTTGKAGYCNADGHCFDCRKDADCISECGPNAACTQCSNCPGGFACFGPENDSCVPPKP